MHGFIDFTKHQLDDFLPGGKFAEEASPELWQSMPHTIKNQSKSINHLLSKAREQRISLRKKHIEQEKLVMQKEAAQLEANHRQKMENEATEIELRGP